MSDERIDLTQFDNITSYPDGGWEVPEEDNLSKTLVADLDGSLVCSTSAMAQIEGYSLEEAQHFARTIAQLPNIVAELKRCYKREDVANEALLENAKMMREYVGQIIDLKRKIQHVIDACEGVDTLFGEEVVGMLQD